MSKMTDYEQKSVTSKIVGVVYTDLVVYIIPGLFLILGISLIFNLFFEIEKIISKANVVSTIVFIIIVPATSYLMGIMVSFFRWYLYFPSASFGKFLFGDINKRILKMAGMPESVREMAKEKIIVDLKKLGWLKNNSNDSPNGETNIPPKEDMIPLFDCFWNLLLNNLRESGSILFSYYDRWTDIDALRQNLIISLQILSVLLTIKISISFSFGVLPIFIGGIICLLVIFLLGIVNLYVFPKSLYLHMRWILLAYLTGKIEIIKEDHKSFLKPKRRER